MIDFSSWVERTIPVTSLLLDAKNFRIPTAGVVLGQRELIADLVEHEGVYELARDIAQVGFIPVELMIGVVESGKQIIVEGNRRLAALKLLISPEIAPEKAIQRFRQLSGTVPVETIKRVKVIFAPNRDAAAPVILAKHTREQVDRWSVISQAKFYRSLAESGATVQELAERFRRPPGEIAQFLRNEELYEMACGLELPQKVREIVQNPRTFPASIVERLFEFEEARRAFGIEFDDQGRVHGKAPIDEFRRGYARVLTDIDAKRLNTRSINTALDTKKYIAALGADAPNVGRRGRFTVTDFRPSSDSPEAPPPVKATGRPQRGRPWNRLLPRSVKCRVDDPRIRQIYVEVQRLMPVDRYPNACAALLRVLLELSMGYYLERTGKIAPLLESTKKERKGDDWYPSWKQMLKQLLADADVPKISPLARKVLNPIAHDKNSVLDGFVHSRFVAADPHQLRVFASAMEGLLQYLLGDESSWPKKPSPRT